MLTVSGGNIRLCSGLSRRDLLRVGGLGVAGFTLADLFHLRAAAAATPGKARNIIMIHLNGGPSHIDTFDPKPDAPTNIKGEFKPINTNVDGIQICEHLPKMAQMMDKLVVLRAINKGVDEHSSSHTMTGYSNRERRVQGDKPSIGSVLWKVNDGPNMLVPGYVSLRGTNMESGLGSGYLEAAYEPLSSNGPGRQDLSLNPRITPARMNARKRLLAQVDDFGRHVMDAKVVTAQDAFTQRAMSVLASSKTRDAFDNSKEPKAVRDQYKGAESFLTARRLVESGVNAVALSYGSWDTHGGNFQSLKQQLPQLDQAFTALVKDLEDRGLLKETLIVMWGEFGRTPRINSGAGRDHWPGVMSAVLAGGALRTGQAYGESDGIGAYAQTDATPIRQVLATIYAALGIDPHTEFMGRDGRPMVLIPDEEPIGKLI